MIDYLTKRLGQSILTFVLLIIVIFLITHTIGDPASTMLPDTASEEMIQALRNRLGLNDPLYVQFRRYVVGLLRLDLGTSFWQEAPVLKLIMGRLPPTLYLAIAAISLATFGGILLGTLAAIKPGSALDRFASTLSVIFVTSLDFWVAIMLIMLVCVWLGWLPTSGYGEIKHIILPALVIAFRPLGRIAQVTRPAVADELAKQYIVAARAKGIPEKMVILNHAVRNAGIVLLTLTGTEFIHLAIGSVIVESVFGWPGMGFLLVQAVSYRDWPLIVGITIVVASMVIVLNLAVDLLYGWLDPRIRYQ